MKTLSLLTGLAAGCETSVIIADYNPPTSVGGGAAGGPIESDRTDTSGGAGGAGSEEPFGPRPVFGSPRLITELSDPDAKDQDPSLTGDLLEIYFFSDRDGGEPDLWTARRMDIDQPWDPPTLVAELSAPELDINPAVSRDGLTLWFHSQREPSGIYRSERNSREVAWGSPVHVEAFGGNIAPAPSANGLRMGISTLEVEADPEHRDILESVRPSLDAAWSPLQQIEGINGPHDDSTPFLVDDGREILFSSARTGSGDLYWTYRPDLHSPVVTPQALEELNTPESLESHPHLSPDGRRIFFGSGRSGSTDLYEAELQDLE